MAEVAQIQETKIMQFPAKPLSDQYIGIFSEKGIAKRYNKKFKWRPDLLRHLTEVDILSPVIHGKFLDCSVGTGRLIPYLKRVTEFHAADTSAEFIAYVQKQYPFVQVKPGDLRKPLEYPNEMFDSVMSMRTLFAIGPIRNTIAEMDRICKPGGNIIFDYPNVPLSKRIEATEEEVNYDMSALGKYQESPDAILNSMSNITYEKIPLDLFLHTIKSNLKKARRRAYRKRKDLLSPLAWWRLSLYYLMYWACCFIPASLMVRYERLSHRYPALSLKAKDKRNCKRYLYICTKQA